MDTILDNTLGENYFDTRVVMDFVSVCHHRCQQVFWRCYRETVAVILSNQVCPCIFYLSLSMDNVTPINQFVAPTGAQLEPPESSKPILTPGYELRLSLVSLVQE